MASIRAVGTILAFGLLTLVTGCAGAGTPSASTAVPHPAPPRASSPAAAPPAPAAPGTPGPPGSAAGSASSASSAVPGVDPRSVSASLSIPAIGVKDLEVVPYEGTTDDWPGTRIQDRGVAASPYGDEGGIGPGETGNYLVTAHRLSAGGPLRDLPELDKGDTVRVELGDAVYTYEITASRWTSFRSARSLEEQRAAVPGKPGVTPTQAMITISTCATPEDNAAGNFWRDDRKNPEHRIDRVGVLVSTGSAGAGGAPG
ncbi:class E sortase [Streptomyces cadmiisoli]|uniref:Sortase n=1 Tax=Streptomyces cadmiisoli TaxID=2184053 RepID=A0A2Z4J8L5_9ACTN|nr:class E sortase [Streptomyces cadmiisoli]AWW41277.1 sortase [Streptomyces cadmiisoli]